MINVKNLIILIVLLFAFFYCKENQQKDKLNKEYAIITASTLNSRKNPDLNSEIVGRYPFGSPLEIDSSDSFEGIVNGEKGKWIKEKETNGFIFNKFYLTTFGIVHKLKGVVDICNFACGGGCFIPPADIFLIGNYYVQIDEHMDYLAEEVIPCSTIKIGKYNSISNEFSFSSPIHYAGYNGKEGDCRISFVKNVDSVGEKRILSSIKKTFMLKKMSDSKGIYYIINNTNIYDRTKYHEYCSEQSLHDKVVEIFDSYYIDDIINEGSIYLNYINRFNEKVYE